MASMADQDEQLDARERAKLAALPLIFSYGQAREAGLSQRRIYWLRDRGLIEPLVRGTYRRTDVEMKPTPT